MGRRRQRIRCFPARGNVATQFSPPLAHVTHLRAILGRSIKRHLLEIFVADRHTKAIAKCLQALHIQLLQRVGFVARLARLAGAVSFYGHRQNDRGALHLLTGGRVSGVHLIRVMPTPIEVHDVFVAQILHQLQRLGILPEEVLPGVGTPIELAIL